jgi:hypothetical protein
MKSKIILHPNKFKANSELVEKLSNILDEYVGKISTAEALGALEILKYDLLVSIDDDIEDR